jgi:hypothetical protein
MLMEKKVYRAPEVTPRGNVEEITQGFGEIGSGDLIFTFTDGKWGTEGCADWHQFLCTGS